MNKNQIQVDVLKQMLSKDTRYKRTQKENGFIGVTDGYFMVFLHESEWKIKLDGLIEFNYDISNAFSDHPILLDTGIRKSFVAKLASEDGKTVSYVNEKYIRTFKGYCFSSDGGTSQIYVKDNTGELVGLVMPIRCYEKDRF